MNRNQDPSDGREALCGTDAGLRRSTDREAPIRPDEPTVSVVLPTYDRASVLGGAVESVFEQTHAPLELIVVDGGSTDGTVDVLDAIDDDRLRVLRREAPDGPSASRNAGIRAAAGDLVAFVDDDDRWRPEKLRRQVDALAREDASASLTRVTKADGEPRTRTGVSGDVYEAIRRLDLPTYTSTLVARRSALGEVGGFDESLGCFEDWELCLRLARERAFAFVDEPLVVKGTGQGNISAEPDRLARAFDRLDRRYDLPRTARARFLADVGMTHCEAGRIDEGIPHLIRSLRLDPTRAKVAIALALALAASVAGTATPFTGGMDRVYGIERSLGRWRA
ncbi:glycosyltransferase family 2 protein [Halomarina pelagica]|uniref:glycosyltransferase family 2 protein n=1 Tax=Halomarina pelagica TaxID=2961599 RepID=UPI0020C4CCF3|nr:glycosyltransferase family 2 protein [Halomarina sp. BND7]